MNSQDMIQERRLDGEDGLNGEGPDQPDWNGMYTLEQAGGTSNHFRRPMETEETDELSQEATEGIRHLSIDEHREVKLPSMLHLPPIHRFHRFDIMVNQVVFIF